MSVKQGIINKKRAKNKKAKYTYAATKTVSQSTNNKTTTKKFAYTKKILSNGKYRYYYN